MDSAGAARLLGRNVSELAAGMPAAGRMALRAAGCPATADGRASAYCWGLNFVVFEPTATHTTLLFPGAAPRRRTCMRWRTSPPWIWCSSMWAPWCTRCTCTASAFGCLRLETPSLAACRWGLTAAWTVACWSTWLQHPCVTRNPSPTACHSQMLRQRRRMVAAAMVRHQRLRCRRRLPQLATMATAGGKCGRCSTAAAGTAAMLSSRT